MLYREVKEKGEKLVKMNITSNNKSRYGRGVLLAEATPRNVRKIPHETIWKVRSQTVKDRYYYVIEKDDGCLSCTCPDYEMRGEICKHILAVILTEVA